MIYELFIDTNVIIDYLTNRKPFSKSAYHIFSLAEKGIVRLNISVISFTTIYYILRRNNSHQKIINSLSLLSRLCKVIPLDQNILDQAMKSDFSDFEDAVQYYSALQNKNCSTIISRNTKDFQSSIIKVMLPDELLNVNEFNPDFN